MQEKRVVEGYESINRGSQSEVGKLVSEKFPEGAYMYAVLDNAVGFGRYENGKFLIGLGRETTPGPLQWKYLRELRVFNGNGELCLRPFEGKWVGRLRGSMVKTGTDKNEYYVDEQQKLWGKKKDGNQGGISKWTLLTSERGTQIQIPMHLDGENQTEAALVVRKYMRIPTETNQELVYQTDLRMMGLCPWKQEGE